MTDTELVKPLLALLITRRITTLITEDKLTEPVREAIHRRYPQDTQLGYLITCRRCSSVWAGIATLLLLSLGNGLAVRTLTGALALSEASIVADTLLDRLDTGFNL